MNPTQGKNKKIGILFVCLGNICRSPAAEGIMTKIVEKNELQDLIEVDSAGTSGWHEGELPDERMRSHGEKRGYDFCSRSRKFNRDDLHRFDYVIVMDKDNYNTVIAMAAEQKQREKVHLISEYAVQSNHGHDIPDPYYGGPAGFELVLDLLEDACEGLLKVIKKEHALF